MNGLELALNKALVEKFCKGENRKAQSLFWEAPVAPKYKRIIPGVVTCSNEDGEVFIIIKNSGKSVVDGNEYSFVDFDVRDSKGSLIAREACQWDAVEEIMSIYGMYCDSHPHNHADDKEYRKAHNLEK